MGIRFAPRGDGGRESRVSRFPIPVPRFPGARVPFPAGEADFEDLLEVEFSATPEAGPNSGAPVLTPAGELVGMAYRTSAKAVSVIPSERIMAVLDIARRATKAGESPRESRPCRHPVCSTLPICTSTGRKDL